ncbi:D-2-hydroxyacid dehydrogenase [Paenibacillus thalictri]|uniref:D-2-hydroxyacid dehydrogenase n=1 Tax=Paenibacillus thalictri TaxID=2527873 RepID=A0A4Q9DUS8_9BACL|nr:D-2-hydroxyacid dehydrogenase [Paenibacillus thalictri]TBL80115.1 D-2-hydroxyacid dehydrogenase [Paenibacillus thalictri]
MQQTKVILCRTGDYNPGRELVQALEREFPEVHFIDLPKGEFEQRKEEVKDAQVFVGWPDENQLNALPELRWIQLPSAGANGYTQRSALAEHVIVTNSSGVFGVAGAEHAIALMLAFTRQLHVHYDQQRRKIWKRNPYCLEVQDSTVGIIGLGDIGGGIAQRAKGLGARVIAVKRTVTACPPFVDRLYALEDVDSLLAEADFLVLALPLTAETQGFLNAERIGRIKKGAVLINVGRGPTVDESALIRALQNGDISGAGLDVTDVEPLPQISPLWELPNVLITSHSVGVTPRKEERRVSILRQNLRRFLSGEEMMNRVDRTAGY